MEKDILQRKKIRREIVWKCNKTPFIWSDLKNLILEDNDEIFTGPEDDEDGFILCIYRTEEESEEEYQQRLKSLEELEERRKKERYKKYLELKKEFE